MDRRKVQSNKYVKQKDDVFHVSKKLIEIGKKTNPKIKVDNWLKIKKRKHQGQKVTCNTLNN